MALDVVTGARARLSFSGVKVGYATGVSLREMIQYEPLKVLDDIQVQEHIPVDYDVSMTADVVRIVGDSLKKNGWFPSQGANSAAFLLNVINSGELVADIEDSVTGKIIYHVEGVKISERNVTISARGIVGKNVSMVAKRARDEFDLV